MCRYYVSIPETIQYLCVRGIMYVQQQLLITTNQPSREERERERREGEREREPIEERERERERSRREREMFS